MEAGGKVYLMPESGEGDTLTVYEAVAFPDKWEKRRVLRSRVKFADTTPLPKAGLHLALTHRVDDPENPQLILIDLEGKIADIVVPKVTAFRSRPAGHIFNMDGKIIRPAQLSEDCGTGYGKGLIFCECDLAEDLHYSEAEITTIYPKDLKYNRAIFLDGMHTYNACGHYEVIDIKNRRFNILNLFMRVVSLFRRR
jgi:hypothetical protein